VKGGLLYGREGRGEEGEKQRRNFVSGFDVI